MIYFVSGHRDITKEEFEKYYVMALRTAYYEDDKPEFVVGDYKVLIRWLWTTSLRTLCAH